MTLLLRLQGPMQSWGTQSRFEQRDTGREPSKSGVIGLLCAALGRPRVEPLDDLAALRMGVRVDQEGKLEADYHTTGGGTWRDHQYGVASVGGGLGGTVLSQRFYLADADFLVGLEGDGSEQEALLQELDRSLQRPVWALCLGRKSMVPARPPRLPDVPPYGPGLRVGSVRETLLSYPWPAKAQRLRFVWEAETSIGGEVRMDVPVSFVPGDRRFRERVVRTEFHSSPIQYQEESTDAIP